MKHGDEVSAFERKFAQYVGAKYAIACANGTVTLQGALHALGVQQGDRVAVPPLTMAATSIAVLNVGAEPVFCDVNERTWLMDEPVFTNEAAWIPVALYGLHNGRTHGMRIVCDAAQTLMPHRNADAFTSYSFQASKILSTGEGGMLVTDSEELAANARSYLSLGYKMGATQARIDSSAIKAPTFARHHLAHSINGRMNDATACHGLSAFSEVYGAFDELEGVQMLYPNGLDALKAGRRQAAKLYVAAIEGCEWLTPQHVPDGWKHDYWCYAIACDTPERAVQLSDAIVKHGGERPYAAWRLTYQEPAFRHLAPDGTCPIAESLQPRLLQFQTNHLAIAERNAHALRLAIQELS